MVVVVWPQNPSSTSLSVDAIFQASVCSHLCNIIPYSPWYTFYPTTPHMLILLTQQTIIPFSSSLHTLFNPLIPLTPSPLCLRPSFHWFWWSRKCLQRSLPIVVALKTDWPPAVCGHMLPNLTDALISGWFAAVCKSAARAHLGESSTVDINIHTDDAHLFVPSMGGRETPAQQIRIQS